MLRKPLWASIARLLLRVRVPFGIAAATILLCCVSFCASANASSCGSAAKGASGVAALQSRGLVPISEVQEAAQSNSEDNDDSIVGLWHVFFLVPPSPEIPSGVFDEGFDQFHSDGLEILNDSAEPQPANGAGTVCLGVYKKIGRRSYKLKHPFWSVDELGHTSGSGVILETIKLSADARSFQGSFTFISYDLKGVEIPNSRVEGHLKAERITPD